MLYDYPVMYIQPPHQAGKCASSEQHCKKKSIASCEYCKKKHLRCEIKPNETACIHCIKKGLTCVFTQKTKREHPDNRKKRAILEQEVEEWKGKYLKLLSTQPAVGFNLSKEDSQTAVKIRQALVVAPALDDFKFVLTDLLNEYLQMYLLFLQPVYKTKYQVQISGDCAQFLLGNEPSTNFSNTLLGMHLNIALAFGARMRGRTEDAQQLIDKARNYAAELFDKAHIEVVRGLILMANFFFDGGDKVRTLHFNGMAQSMCKALDITNEKNSDVWNQITLMEVQCILQRGTEYIKEHKPKLHKLMYKLESKLQATQVQESVTVLLMRATAYICSCLFNIEEPLPLGSDGNIEPALQLVLPKIEPDKSTAQIDFSCEQEMRNDFQLPSQMQACSIRDYFQVIVDMIDYTRRILNHYRETLPQILQLTYEIEFGAFAACVLWRYVAVAAPSMPPHAESWTASSSPPTLASVTRPEQAREEALREGNRVIELAEHPDVRFCQPHVALPLEQLAYVFLEANQGTQAEQLLRVLCVLSNTHPVVNQNVYRLKTRILSHPSTLQPPPIDPTSSSPDSVFFAPVVTLSPQSPVYSTPSAPSLVQSPNSSSQDFSSPSATIFGDLQPLQELAAGDTDSAGLLPDLWDGLQEELLAATTTN